MISVSVSEKKKVFLGGTCNESSWRDILIPLLDIDYFNPVVDDWTEECMKEELIQREVCDYCLYVITPRMVGVYSIAEAVDDSNKRPEKTIFCVLHEEPILDVEYDGRVTYPSLIKFSYSQLKSLGQVGRMVEENGGKYFTSLIDVAEYLNNSK